MIHKIGNKGRPGRSFRGTLDYVFREGIYEKLREKENGEPEWIGGNMPLSDARGLSRFFRYCREMRPEIEDPVFHASLSLPPNEKMDRNQWQDAVSIYLKELGFTENHPYTIVRHHDTDHEHVHIVASRIGYDGKLNRLGRSQLRGMKACRLIEKEFGITQLPTSTYEVDGETRELPHTPALQITPSKAEFEKAKRMFEKGKASDADPSRRRLQKIIDNALMRPIHLDDFCEVLRAQGVEVKPLFQKGKDGKPVLKGLKYTLTNEIVTDRKTGKQEPLAFKASSLGTQYKVGALFKRGLRFGEQALNATDKERLKKARAKKRMANQELWFWIKLFDKPLFKGQKTSLAWELMKIYFALCAIEKRYKALQEIKEITASKRERLEIKAQADKVENAKNLFGDALKAADAAAQQAVAEQQAAQKEHEARAANIAAEQEIAKSTVNATEPVRKETAAAQQTLAVEKPAEKQENAVMGFFRAAAQKLKLGGREQKEQPENLAAKFERNETAEAQAAEQQAAQIAQMQRQALETAAQQAVAEQQAAQKEREAAIAAEKKAAAQKEADARQRAMEQALYAALDIRDALKWFEPHELSRALFHDFYKRIDALKENAEFLVEHEKLLEEIEIELDKRINEYAERELGQDDEQFAQHEQENTLKMLDKEQKMGNDEVERKTTRRRR